MNGPIEHISDLFGMRGVELVAVIFGLINVCLIIRRSVWNYPFGIVMVSLYAWIFFVSNLYGNAALQIFFTATQLYGWRHWLRSLDVDGRVLVIPLTRVQAAAYCVITALGVAAAGWIISFNQEAAYPYWDGAIVALSVVAQILLARRNIENWHVWIAVDVLAVGLYARQGLHLTAGLYSVFLALAIFGYFEWRRARMLEAGYR